MLGRSGEHGGRLADRVARTHYRGVRARRERAGMDTIHLAIELWVDVLRVARVDRVSGAGVDVTGVLAVRLSHLLSLLRVRARARHHDAISRHLFTNSSATFGDNSAVTEDEL